MLTRNRKRSLPEFMQVSGSSQDKISRTDSSGRTQSFESLEVFQELTNKGTTETVKAKTTYYREKIVKKPLELVKYNGKIEFFLEARDIAAASDALYKYVDSQTDCEVVPVGFDMEWPFNFTTGPQKTALIQICATHEQDLEVGPCYLFHVTRLDKLPPAFMEFLRHPKIRWHGVNIKNDFRKLQRDFPEVDSQALIDQCVDLGVYCNQVCSTSGRWSMERLVAYVCKKQIDKNKEVRNSRWNVLPLTHHQKLYAAIDVYISQVIYFDLEKRRRKQEAELLALEIAEEKAQLIGKEEEATPVPEQEASAVSEQQQPKSQATSDESFLDNIQHLIDTAAQIIDRTAY